MYGLIAKIKTTDGKRDELISILMEGTSDMPGCIQYVIAKDTDDTNAIWVTEVWDTQENHQKSLSPPPMQDAIAQGIAAAMEVVI